MMIIQMETEEIQRCVREAGLCLEDAGDWYQKYYNHFRTSKTRGIQSELSFSQYLSKVVAGGLEKPEQIGVTRDKFVLGRIGDEGSYNVNNCRFITKSQNQVELFENGMHVEGNKRRSEQMTGVTAETSERVRKAAESMRGRTKETHAHCQAVSEARSKNFVLIDPSGTEHRGKNLMEFCQKNGLNHFALYGVFAGKRNHHKGWAGYYADSI